ncbi:MAG: iron ABC transporter permease [Kiritimatiellae bacterium]|nr:iron ABC transporter permease [Kiritimatiellia bacterium]MDD4026141.1 iron ABC transporter permease [Kiritimatiellia bacterium]
MPGTSLTEQYARHGRRKLLAGCALLGLIAAAVWVSLRTGAYPVGARDMIAALAGQADGAAQHVFWNIRMPQTLAALLAGACLGLAGAALQAVLRNPLASPFTLGISQGATFGAVFAITVLGAGAAAAPEAVPASDWLQHVIVGCAFLGALATVCALVGLSSLRDLPPAGIILAGVAISSFFGSATMLLQYFATDVEIASAVFWTFGDLKKAQWPQLAVIAAALLPVSVILQRRSWHFNAMAWGDDTAKSLGIGVRPLRLATLVLAALAVSVTTAFMGIIGFVGLIAPHIVRMVTGQDHRYLFPYSALTAGLLLLVSDLLARTLLAPIVLPVGILTSFAGAPLFLYLLLKHRGPRS